MKKVSILDLTEDLLDDDPPNSPLRPQKTKLGSAITDQSRMLSEATLEGFVTEVASALGITFPRTQSLSQRSGISRTCLEITPKGCYTISTQPPIGSD